MQRFSLIMKINWSLMHMCVNKRTCQRISFTTDQMFPIHVWSVSVFNFGLPKTTDFQVWQSMLTVPSLLHQWSSRERIFEKWCFGEEEEAKEVRRFCKIMLVHHNTMNICSFSTQFFTRKHAVPDVCTEQNEFEKKSIFITFWSPHLSSQKFILQ